MVEQQQKLVLSPYMKIYELVVPKGNLLRQIKELVDFSFIYDELINKYCLDNGRNAVPPVRMFKYLLLKSIYDLSDIDVVERSKYDMSFKFFLDMAPEESVINPSSLTKFRKLRLKDMNLLDMLITKTVRIAIEKGIIKSRSIIVDATHTRSRYNQKTPRQALLEQSKKLRRAVYEIDGTMKEQFPNKNTEDSLEKELAYCHALLSVIKEKAELCSYPKVREKLNLLEEAVKDDLEHIETSRDADAKTGHKTADSSFFGYKTHIAMSEERIITAATVTSGEKTDGKELPELVRKSREAGMEVEMVIEDRDEEGNRAGAMVYQVVEETKTVFSVREVPLLPEAVYILEHLRAHHDQCGYKDRCLAYDGRNTILVRSLDRTLRKLCKYSNVSYFNTHMIRKTFATMLHASGMPTRYISDLLGHSDMVTTEKNYILAYRDNYDTLLAFMQQGLDFRL